MEILKSKLLVDMIIDLGVLNNSFNNCAYVLTNVGYLCTFNFFNFMFTQ